MTDRAAPSFLSQSLVVLAAVGLCGGLLASIALLSGAADTIEVEVTEYSKPAPAPGPKLKDDRLEDKNPEFDPELVDSRLLDGWEINTSAAVISLDCPMMKPDRDEKLLELRPSYADSSKASSRFLPSANLIDGANKQFDDGLVAALALATYRGDIPMFPAVPDLVESIAERLAPENPARPFLAAALSLAGREVQLDKTGKQWREMYLDDFRTDSSRSKPLGFYNWSEELQTIWRFYRFLQTELKDREFGGEGVGQHDLQIARDIAAVLAANAELRKDYLAVNGFFGTLTNPAACLAMNDLVGAENKSLIDLSSELGVRRSSVAFLPPSTNREAELFATLFPEGLPSNANLMAELIAAVQSGQTDLSPTEGAGWYQHQVFALETLILPSRGLEEQKLLLKKKYKERLVEAFKALITKRKETHILSGDAAAGAAAEAFHDLMVVPQLRVEPCVTYYLRTAWAYAFLQTFLESTVGEDSLAKIHGLTKNGPRELSILDEIEQVRQRNYGMYLISCEDIGLRPRLDDGELDDTEGAKQKALTWLEQIETDSDLAQDTRVAVPVYFDPRSRRTRIWVTLGVRQAKLTTRFVRPPSVRSEDEPEWKPVNRHQLHSGRHVIAVDEFAEVSIPGLTCPTREELRQVCNRHKTKEAIVKALQKGEW